MEECLASLLTTEKKKIQQNKNSTTTNKKTARLIPCCFFYNYYVKRSVLKHFLQATAQSYSFYRILPLKLSFRSPEIKNTIKKIIQK